MWTREGFYYFLTLTAPGVESHCKKAGCDGVGCHHERCLCTPSGGIDLAEWNSKCSRLWNRFLLELERVYRVRPVYFRAVEVQNGDRRADKEGRGALHLHVILWSPRKYSTRTVRRLAIKTGFGHEVKLEAITPGSKAAAFYCAKYVSKSCDARDDAPWLGPQLHDEDGEKLPREPAPATFRTWSQSAKWGKTMREIRLRAHRRYVEDQVLRELETEAEENRLLAVELGQVTEPLLSG
jgi:hypothetical protein